MDKITFILPLTKFDKKNIELLERSLSRVNDLNNIKNNKLMISTTEDIKKNIVEKVVAKYQNLNKNVVSYSIFNGDEDIYDVINKSVNDCTTPYFSVFGFDDEYENYWTSEVEKYSDNGYSVIMPLNEYYNAKNGDFLTFGNEIAWDASFTEKLGNVTSDDLNVFFDFQLYGAIIKTNDFISYGGLKKSLKIAAQYEFLLRIAYNNCTMFVIPKVGYKKLIGREDSYSVLSQKSISQEEGEWLIKTAKQEYFFKEDRNRTMDNNLENNQNEVKE